MEQFKVQIIDTVYENIVEECGTFDTQELADSEAHTQILQYCEDEDEISQTVNNNNIKLYTCESDYAVMVTRI